MTNHQPDTLVTDERLCAALKTQWEAERKPFTVTNGMVNYRVVVKNGEPIFYRPVSITENGPPPEYGSLSITTPPAKTASRRKA